LKLLPRTIINLNLSSCGNISGKGLKYLPDSIQYLSLINCGLITDEGLKHLPRNIKKIDLHYTSVSDEGLKDLHNRNISFGYDTSFKKLEYYDDDNII